MDTSSLIDIKNFLLHVSEELDLDNAYFAIDEDQLELILIKDDVTRSIPYRNSDLINTLNEERREIVEYAKLQGAKFWT